MNVKLLKSKGIYECGIIVIYSGLLIWALFERALMSFDILLLFLCANACIRAELTQISISPL